MTRAQRKAADSALKARKREVDAQASSKRKSLKQLAKESERGLTESNEAKRAERRRAKDVYGAIGYDLMFEDGTCQVEEGLYSQTIAFSDISYQAARDEDQKALFNTYSQIFDYSSSATALQLNVINTPLPDSEIGTHEFFDVAGIAESAAADGATPEAQERLAGYAEEYNDILNRKLLEGVSNLRRDRYLTLSVAADDYVSALPKLASVRGQAMQTFQKLGCSAHMLDGAERTMLIGEQLRPGRMEQFSYDDPGLWLSGLTSKDYVCPSGMDFQSDSTSWEADGKHFQTLVFRQFGSALTDISVSSLADLPIPLNVSLHIQPLPKGKAIDFVKRRNTWIDSEVVDQQRKAVKGGYDPNLLPQELTRSKTDAEELLAEMNYQGQNLFVFSGTVTTWADDEDTLQQRALKIIATARQNSIEIDVLDCQQREGMNSALPLGNNHIGIGRYLTTAQVSMMIPFATQELSDAHGGYYGQNKLSSNLIMLDRKHSLAAPMGFAFGTPGSGKSFAIKREITNTFLSNPDDEFLIIDPNSEYIPLVEALGGAVVQLSPSSEDHINLFDIYSGAYDVTDEDPVSIKAESVLAIAEEILGRGGYGMSGGEKTVVDRAVREVYRKFEDSPVPPTLGDFYDVLVDQPEREAADMARAFELYVSGSLSYFNHQSTVDIEQRITCFSFKQLGSNMKTFAMLIILDYVYNRMLLNFERGVTTWVYIDEVQSLFSSGDAVFEIMDRLWSEGRKYNLIPTGISQLPERIIEHPQAKYLLSNSDFLLLLKQSDRDRKKLADILELSPQQTSWIDRSISPGEGLLIAGGAKIPFKDDFPHGGLYDLWNTKPQETADSKRAEWLRRKSERGAPEEAEDPAADEQAAPAGSAAPGADDDAELDALLRELEEQ